MLTTAQILMKLHVLDENIRRLAKELDESGDCENALELDYFRSVLAEMISAYAEIMTDEEEE